MASITASAFTVIPYAFPSFFFFRKDSFVFALINFFFSFYRIKIVLHCFDFKSPKRYTTVVFALIFYHLY